MSTEKSIENRSLGDTLADVFHEFSILLRYMRFRIAERLRSPLWRFIGGQRPVEYDEVDLLETAAPEQMQKPEDVLIPLRKEPKPEGTNDQAQLQNSKRLLDMFGAKFNARESRKREAASKASKASRTSDGLQMEFDFSTQNETVDELEAIEDIVYSIPEGEYMLPPFTLFETKEEDDALDTEEIEATRKSIQDCLDNFNFDAEVGDAIHGPTVTLYKVTVGKGVRVATIASLDKDIEMALSAPSMRILAPVSGTTYAGIEVPNKKPSIVLCGNILNGRAWHQTKAQLPLILGRDINGNDVVMDLSKAPHLLVAGATGTGKSVCLNTFIVSMISRFSPEDLKLMLVDPKRVEMQAYNTLPHLLVPVINDVEVVLIALRWLCYEMERRYSVLGKVGVKKLSEFNSRPPMTEELLDNENKPIPQKMPFIVLVIDELADIMLTAKREVEMCLGRLAAKSRAVGIHVIVATQRPSVDVLTGTIKGNFPTRIAFRAASQIDSRTILDGMGAESLLGKGDMLFKSPSGADLQRIQGAMVTDEEIEKVVKFCSCQGYLPPRNFESIKNSATVTDNDEGKADMDDDSGSDAKDDLMRKAIEIIFQTRKSSISYLQRSLGIGYNKAASLVDEMEKHGILGPEVVKGKREIIPESFEEAMRMLEDDCN